MSVALSPAGVWQIDANHSQVGFSVRHLGISTVHGLFTSFTGEATIGADLASTSVRLVVAMASITTGNTWRDDNIVGEKFFDCDRFPEMTFASTAIDAADDRYHLCGDLAIRDVTMPVRFDVEFAGTAEFAADKSLRAGFLATSSISRTAFGIGYGVPVASDEVALRLDVQLVAPRAS